MNNQSIIIFVVIAVVVLYLLLGKRSPARNAKNSTEQDIIVALNNGDKIQAIKHYRDVHNAGLKEAKDAVEEMQEKIQRP